MIPSPASSSSGVLRRMLIEASPHIRCSDEDQTFAEGQRIEHSDIECQLEDIQVHGRMDGVDSWSNVIADTMLSMSASPRPQNELVFHQRRSIANVSTLANDSDSDAPQDLQLSPNGMDDDDDEDDDDRDNILSMSMDQDSQDLNESASSALSRLAEDSSILGHASHVPRKKGRPAKFAVAGALKSGAECPVCGKVFNNSSALAKHKLTHSSERKYVCRLCEKTFKRQDHLNGHMLTHSSKKPFECRFPSCGRSYCDARSLRRHHDNYHLRLPDTSGVASRPSSAEGLLVPPLSALQAERLMASSTSSLSPAGSDPTRDMGTVSNSSDSSSLLDLELAHECELCGRRFKNLPALNGHMRLHGGYYKKDMVITSSIEAAKHATRLEPKLTLSPGCRITVSDPNLFANCVHTSDSQWSVPGLLLSAAAHTSSSHGENMSNPANPLYHTPSASQVIVSSGVAGIAHNSILQSSGLLQVDPAQLGFLLSQKCLTSNQSANATDFRAVNQLKSERDPMVLTQKTMSSVPHVKVEDGFKRAVDNVEFHKKYGHLSTHDYTSAANQSVHLSNSTDRDKIVLVKQDAMSSHEASTYKPLTINTDSESMFKFLPTHRETAQSYPAIHQLLQRCNLKVTDILEKESLHKSEIHRVHVDSSHSASCRDKLCTGCRRWTVSDTDKMFGHQHLDATHSFVQPGSHLFRQDSVGFEPHDRNPLALLQEVAEAVDARGNLFPEDSGSYGNAYDEAVFPTPALSGLYHKFRRKNRPEPLIIPAPVTHFGFQSRLRSPRIIADQPAAPVPVTSAPQPNVAASTSTFMPYTPPPMLSPLRTGSGLFCSLVQPSPKSAPVGLRLGLFRNTVADSGSNGNQVVTALPPPFTIKEEEEEEEEEVEEAEEIIDIPVIETEEEIHEVDLAPPPQTDISPHINIGSEYQADIPTYSADRRDAVSDDSLSDLLWDPALMKNISESDVQHYMDFACCSAIPNCGTNKEFALHLLHLCRGDIKAAALKLMRVEPSLPKSHSLHSYKYAETVSWASDEIELYQQAMIKFDKDFFRVSQQVETKSVRECTEFYFLWKKVCVDEWRRIRLIRRKRINLRSAAQQPKLTTSEELCPPSAVNDELCQQGDNRSDVSGAEGVISREAYSRPAPRQEVVSAASELFPCRICGKVFDRVKSRSAHMKSHRQIDSETQH